MQRNAALLSCTKYTIVRLSFKGNRQVDVEFVTRVHLHGEAAITEGFWEALQSYVCTGL